MKVKLINEFFDFYKEPTYTDRVKSHVIDIICQERKISEKSFKQVDGVVEEVNSFFENITSFGVDGDIAIFEKEKCRYQYCAEVIYDRFFITRVKVSQ